jgi:hypothetical protein
MHTSPLVLNSLLLITNTTLGDNSSTFRRTSRLESLEHTGVGRNATNGSADHSVVVRAVKWHGAVRRLAFEADCARKRNTSYLLPDFQVRPVLTVPSNVVSISLGHHRSQYSVRSILVTLAFSALRLS